MATVRKQIKQAIWTWVRDVNDLVDQDDTIFRYEDGPKPSPPFLDVHISKANQPQWSESVKGTKNGNSSHRTHAGRIAIAEMQGFGEATDDWMELAQLSLRNPKTKENLADDGIVVRRMPGGIDEVTEILDTGHERRYVVEFQVAYEVVTDEVETYPAMSVLEMDLDLVDPQKGDVLSSTLSFTA